VNGAEQDAIVQYLRRLDEKVDPVRDDCTRSNKGSRLLRFPPLACMATSLRNPAVSTSSKADWIGSSGDSICPASDALARAFFRDSR
jgi:hypothetical protein